MAYIAGVVIVGLLFFALHYFTELTEKQKIVITAITSFLVLFAIAFNAYDNAKSKKMLEVVMKFQQNSTIKCGRVDVNNLNFSLSIGTYTFIGKKDTPFYGQMISVSSCE